MASATEWKMPTTKLTDWLWLNARVCADIFPTSEDEILVLSSSLSDTLVRSLSFSLFATKKCSDLKFISRKMNVRSFSRRFFLLFIQLSLLRKTSTKWQVNDRVGIAISLLHISFLWPTQLIPSHNSHIPFMLRWNFDRWTILSCDEHICVHLKCVQWNFINTLIRALFKQTIFSLKIFRFCFFISILRRLSYSDGR